MADEPGDARGVPEAARTWLADVAERMNPPEPPERPMATDGGTPNPPEPGDTPESDLDRRVEELEAAVAELDDDLDEKIQDVRDRVVQLKLETDEKATRGHDHPEVVSRLDGAVDRLDALEGDLAPAVEGLDERIASLGRRVDRGFDNFEDVLEYLVETTDDLRDEIGTLAEATVNLRGRAERLAATEARRAAAEDLRRSGANHGVSDATCENCGQGVELALLASPDCPHCGSRFTELEPRRGFFRSSVLHTGERPALEGEVAGASPELGSLGGDGSPPSFDSPGSGPADAAHDGAADSPTGAPGDLELTAIPGIGPAYAEQLAGAGVETVGALALADQERLARDTDIDSGRVETLVGRAREMVESG